MTEIQAIPKGVLKKIINDPFNAVDEMLDGFVAAHADLVRFATPRVIARRQPATDKVGIVIGGGSGHEPAMAGYVGLGFADAAAAGNVFAAPPPDICLDAVKAASSGKGVVLIYGNYSGDILNFGLGVQLAELEGIETRTVLVTDDVASAPAAEIEKRRGIAGDIHVFKCAGALAERGASIDEVERVARKANAATKTMGVALSACEVPGSGRLTFDLPADEIEIGLGIHGEPGMRRGPIIPADEIAAILVETILADFDKPSGHEFALMINGLGATSYLDLYILYRAARRELEQAGNTVTRSLVGEFITSQEMAGASVTVTDLDDELRDLMDAPAHTPRFIQ
jgi:dihydroxyacetone kinase-like protein